FDKGRPLCNRKKMTGRNVNPGLTEPFLIPVPEKSICIESHNYHFVNISMKLTPWRILAVKIPQGLTTNL
ncbi:hypothetical protein, partial [Collinsella aerofaciens]|uniref:hypothetical protein n=1 Tax=Collinsella aerofaciens TaxID=74426 RepID=UPI001C024A99